MGGFLLHAVVDLYIVWLDHGSPDGGILVTPLLSSNSLPNEDRWNTVQVKQQSINQSIKRYKWHWRKHYCKEIHLCVKTVACMKSLKIPKGQREWDNTMAKRKTDQMDKTLQGKLNIHKTNHTKNRGWTRVLRKGKRFMLH